MPESPNRQTAFERALSLARFRCIASISCCPPSKGERDVGALAAYEAAEYLISGDFASAEAALRVDLVGAHHQARRRAPEDSYQLQLQLSERREPTQALNAFKTKP
jgi:hypothetical protein